MAENAGSSDKNVVGLLNFYLAVFKLSIDSFLTDYDFSIKIIIYIRLNSKMFEAIGLTSLDSLLSYCPNNSDRRLCCHCTLDNPY